MASPFDLASLADLKTWLDIGGNDDDALLARLITQISRALLNVLDRPSILPAIYVETYDGGGEASILLRQWPVNAVLSCCVNGEAIRLSSSLFDGAGIPMGYVLDGPDAAPPGRMQRVSLWGRSFARGLQNVAISYSAGYQILGESAIVPANAPYAISALASYGEWACDCGVAYADGAPLAPVASSPTAGRYTFANGVYTFNEADAGALVRLSYGYIPADLAICCMDWVAERYAYRSRIGQQSKSLGGQETMAFLIKDIPDFVAATLGPYRRVVAP